MRTFCCPHMRIFAGRIDTRELQSEEGLEQDDGSTIPVDNFFEQFKMTFPSRFTF
jgi:hypothetical protein